MHIKELKHLKEFYSELAILAIHSKDYSKLSTWLSNDEPHTEKELNQFVDIWKLNFELFNSVHVNGDLAHPIFKFLKSKLKGTVEDAIKWNFSKFLIDRNGIPFKRFSPFDNLIDLEVNIQKLLKKSEI
jgi:glutathione peroxidase-family protein